MLYRCCRELVAHDDDAVAPDQSVAAEHDDGVRDKSTHFQRQLVATAQAEWDRVGLELEQRRMQHLQTIHQQAAVAEATMETSVSGARDDFFSPERRKRRHPRPTTPPDVCERKQGVAGAGGIMARVARRRSVQLRLEAIKRGGKEALAAEAKEAQRRATAAAAAAAEAMAAAAKASAIADHSDLDSDEERELVEAERTAAEACERVRRVSMTIGPQLPASAVLLRASQTPMKTKGGRKVFISPHASAARRRAQRRHQHKK